MDQHELNVYEFMYMPASKHTYVSGMAIVAARDLEEAYDFMKNRKPSDHSCGYWSISLTQPIEGLKYKCETSVTVFVLAESTYEQ